MQSELLDDFRDVSGWSAVASGQAELALSHEPSPHGQALRLDFDFKGGGGFVVARRAVRARACRRAGRSRCACAARRRANKLELKLADPTQPQRLVVAPRRVRVPGRLAAAAHPQHARSSSRGGRRAAARCASSARSRSRSPRGPAAAARVWIADLRFEDLALREPPRVRASSAAAGHAPERALDGSAATSWRSAPARRRSGSRSTSGASTSTAGSSIDWARRRRAARVRRAGAATTARRWRTLWSARQAEGPRSYVYLPGGGRSRYLRLLLREPAGAAGFGIAVAARRAVRLLALAARLLPRASRASERRGLHPRWLHREQSYWTPVGVEGGTTAAILNEEGMLEPDRGSFSLEPFLFADGELVTWADAEVSQSLAESWLPIPSSRWRWRDLVLDHDRLRERRRRPRACARVRYRVENTGRAAQRVRLFAALRPFQVTPPWQAFQGLGGTSPIRELALARRRGRR